MGVSRLVGAGLGVALAASAAMPGAMAAETGVAAFQGAWLASGPNCGEVYTSAGKGASFKRPIDIFAPAFVISGNRLRTPMASCRIKAVRPAGDRQVLVLDCANAVADQEVKVRHGALRGRLSPPILQRGRQDRDDVSALLSLMENETASSGTSLSRRKARPIL